jgi:hypothetical protein
MFEFKDNEGNPLSNNGKNKKVQSFDQWAESNMKSDNDFTKKFMNIDPELRVSSILRVLVDIVNKHDYILDKDVCKNSSNPVTLPKHPLGYNWARKVPNNCDTNESNKSERIETFIRQSLQHASPCSNQSGGSDKLDKVGLQKQFEKNTEFYSDLLKEEYEELKGVLAKKNKTINNTDNQKILSMYSKLKSQEDKLRTFRHTMLEYLRTIDNDNKETINTEVMLTVIEKYTKLQNKAIDQTQNLASILTAFAKSIGF